MILIMKTIMTCFKFAHAKFMNSECKYDGLKNDTAVNKQCLILVAIYIEGSNTFCAKDLINHILMHCQVGLKSG